MLKPFYVCYFIAYGISIPFFPPYLRGLGLSGREVSLLLSVAPTFYLGVPLAWGWLADRTRRPDLLLRIACAGAALGLVPLLSTRTMPALLLVFVGHQFFAVPVLGLADSLALDRMRRGGGDYTRVRLWGSLSFLAAAFLLGQLLAARGRGSADPIVPSMIGAGFLLATLASFGLRGQPGGTPPHLRELGVLLRNRRFLFILIFAPLHWATLAPYHGFLGILASDRGLRPTVTSQAFVVAVASEVAALYLFPRLRRRMGLATLLTISAVVTVVRWALVARTSTALTLVALQSLHGFTFGIFWGAAMAWLAEAVPTPLRATGQAVFNMATFGIGNLIGYTACGRIYDATGGAAAAFTAGAVFELGPLALAIAALTAQLQKRRPTPDGPSESRVSEEAPGAPSAKR